MFKKPIIAALERFARVAGYGAAAAVIGAALGPAGAEVLNTAGLAIFIPLFTGLATAADKFVRARAEADGVDLGGVYGG